MAKCIRVEGQGVPVRMSDEDAFQVVVRDRDGEYCSKSFWKDWYDNHASPEHRERVISRLVGNKISAARTLARHDQRGRHGAA